MEPPSSARGEGRGTPEGGVTRWHTTTGLSTTTPIFCVGVVPGKEVPSFDIGKGDGWIAQAAQKAASFALDKAISTFGRPSPS